MEDAILITKERYMTTYLSWSEDTQCYMVNGGNGRYKKGKLCTLSKEAKEKLSMLKIAPHNTHIKGVGFRSDYEGDDQEIEPFFYVVV